MYIMLRCRQSISFGNIIFQFVQQLPIMKNGDNNIGEKSYAKAKRVRNLTRHAVFEKNRASSGLPSYLAQYDSDTRQILIESLTSPVPETLPPLSLLTISFYRRACKPAFLTKFNGDELDPHMTYESLWILAGVQDMEELPNYQMIVQQFEQDLLSYLKLPYPEIKQIAIIAAGNRIIGRPQDILSIVKEDQKQLWVLVNHIQERKILNASHLYPYMEKTSPIAFRTIFQMTNNYRDESIDSILKDEQILNLIIQAFNHPNEEIQKYSIRIIGNVLAEPDDYSHDLMKYGLVNILQPLLKSKSKEIRKDVCWCLANYVYDNAAAKEVLFNLSLIQTLIPMLQSYQTDIKIREQLYYIFSHLVEFGDKIQIYKMALKENILSQCQNDLELEDQNLCKVILDMIYKLIDLGKEFVCEEESEFNPFIQQCKESNLLKIIKKKAYDSNQDISNLSNDIIDMIEDDS